MRIRRIVLVALVGCGVSCHSSARPPGTVPPPPASRQEETRSRGIERHTHENLNAVLWMQTAAEYRASAIQAYRLARLQLDAALADPKWSAATEQIGDASAFPPAVILDLDETVLDNSAFQARQVADASPYSEAVWQAWVEERKGAAVPGALEFLRYAQGRGVTPFYVTNRDHSNEQATRDVMRQLGVPIETSRDTVLTRNEEGWTASDKRGRRQWVAASYRVLLLVGDNFEDFVAGTRSGVAERVGLMQKYEAYWGTKWIVLPNPTYGSWESALTLGQGQLDDVKTLAAKYRSLKTDR